MSFLILAGAFHAPFHLSRQPLHPTYVSVAEITYNSPGTSATLLCKTFTDDLQSALQKQTGDREDLSTPGNLKKAGTAIDAYIRAHLAIRINGQPAACSFQGFQAVDNTIVSRYNIENLHGIAHIEITDTVFYELFPTEIQIIYVTVNGNKKFASIHNPHASLAFDF